MQVNKYTNKAAYDADTTRDREKSAVSLLESNSELVYDGVNVVVDKPSAGIGDLVVYDTTLDKIRYVKSITVNKEQMPASLIPAGVVYARKGDKVLIVSLDDATYNGSKAIRWAASYEVALSGFDLVSGGSFTINSEGRDYSFTYAPGATLADISAQIASNGSLVFHGWTASVYDEEVIMTANTSAVGGLTNIHAVSGCVMRKPLDDKNYQTTLTGVLISGDTEYIRRANDFNSNTAGCSFERLMIYYSTRGDISVNQKPGSGVIIRSSVFTEESNPDLVAAYPTYEDYLRGEHMMQYPSAYGGVLRDGKTNTGLIGGLMFVDIRGNPVARYPCAAAALNYGVPDIPSMGAGAWWLPAVDELYLLMHKRVVRVSETEGDPVNRTLIRMGRDSVYADGNYFAGSCEYEARSMYLYHSLSGQIYGSWKQSEREARPVTSL